MNADKEFSPEYKAHLQSPEWRSIRQAKLVEAWGRCRDCGASPNRLHVHHLTYERLGHELMSDLEVLCKKCHRLRHETPPKLAKALTRLGKAAAAAEHAYLEFKYGKNHWHDEKLMTFEEFEDWCKLRGFQYLH